MFCYLGLLIGVDPNCAVTERSADMDNKYTIKVLEKAVLELKRENQGLEMCRETLGDLYVDRSIKENNEKIEELEFHIDFV